MDTAAIAPARRSRSAALAVRSDVALTFDELFEPVSVDSVASLLAEYKVERARVERIAALFTDAGDLAAVQPFLDAYRDDHHGYTPSPKDLFKLEPAVAVLNAHYWNRALDTTDIYAAMPQPRRDAWNEQIRKRTTPGFDDDTVVLTLQNLLADRKLYFAEKVDGVFRALSREHVTNSPLGFGKRMILQGVYDGYHSSSRCGSISDLREVVAKFMGREVPDWLSTSETVRYAREYRGEWIMLDGGAIKIRVYANGNGHLEVHPEMAWRLNCVLASLYPHAIASEHRQRPRKQPKDWPLYSRPLPFAVLGLLQGGSVEAPRTPEQVLATMRKNRWDFDADDFEPAALAAAAHEGCWRFTFSYSTDKWPARDEACRVLESLGATRKRAGSNVYDFAYDPRAVLREVTASGCLPDQVAFQYFPTPPDLAARVVELAEIGPDHAVLEPSAGQGALADLLPRGRTVCVEVSELHAAILRAKGHTAVCVDFLGWLGVGFDRVVMNPPFSDGRWQAHLEHAGGLVADGGRLVAVLPASARGRNVLPGWSCDWTEPVDFPGTSISVTVLVANREAARDA